MEQLWFTALLNRLFGPPVLALLQAIGGVIALSRRESVGLGVLILAGLVVVPLSNATAERFFELPP